MSVYGVFSSFLPKYDKVKKVPPMWFLDEITEQDVVCFSVEIEDCL